MTRLFRGLEQTDYRDLLRTLGRALDARGVRDLRLIERPEGFLVQARSATDPSAGFWTEHVGDGDLLRLMREGHRLRGSGPLASLGGWRGLRYQDLLRAIGRLLDEEGCREVRLVEEVDGMIMQMHPRGMFLRDFQSRRLGPRALRALVREAAGRRGSGDPGQGPPTSSAAR